MTEMKNKTAEAPLHKVLGPIHVWALGVGIVLVGDFMGWNLGIQQGGSLGALIGLWIMGSMYAGQVMMVSEMAVMVWPISSCSSRATSRRTLSSVSSRRSARRWLRANSFCSDWLSSRRR